MRKLIPAAAAAATLVVPAVASAHLNTHGPAKVAIHACVAKHGHKARLAKHCTRKERGVTIWLKAVRVPQRTPAVQASAATNSTSGTNSTVGADGTVGTLGVGGITGLSAVTGTKGAQGATGPQGPAGVSSPWTWSYTGGWAPDTNVLGKYWANDQFSTEFQVIPQEDGSFLIVKSITGTFTTIPGASFPNDTTGQSSQVGGKTGTMNAVEQWTVPAGAVFDPTATPDLNNMRGNEAQNTAFTADFFSTIGENGKLVPAVYTGVGHGGSDYDFVYHLDGQTMFQTGVSPAGNVGDLTNG
jgi:hypothetical protein